jgi:hypothetical protein
MNSPTGVYRYHSNGVFSLSSPEEKLKMSFFVKEKILEKHSEYENNPN